MCVCVCVYRSSNGHKIEVFFRILRQVAMMKKNLFGGMDGIVLQRGELLKFFVCAMCVQIIYPNIKKNV